MGYLPRSTRSVEIPTFEKTLQRTSRQDSDGTR